MKKLKQIVEEIIEESNSTIKLSDKGLSNIEKWIMEKGSRETSVKLIDYVLIKKIGLSSADLPDTTTFMYGLDKIEKLLNSKKYQAAFDLAHKTAMKMLKNEGYNEMGESVDMEEYDLIQEVAPPNFPVELENKILKQYGKTPKAYATMWKLHKKHGDKLEELIMEKKRDRCLKKADAVYGKKTSAYKSGAVVRCRKGDIWKLNEAQTFDFKKHKNEIINGVIKKIKKNETVNLKINPIYTVIAGDTSGSLNAHQKLGYTQKEVDAWKRYFDSNVFTTNGPWSQRNINPNFQRKTGNRTYNYYVTLKKDKNNINKFLSNLGKLDIELQKLSDENQTPISYKTHRHLDWIITHNDSFKIYYYDQDLKQNIEDIVKKWSVANNIETTDRTHHHGVDIKDQNSEATSYGFIISKEIIKILQDQIKKYPDATDEQWIAWLEKYTPEIIKQFTIKENEVKTIEEDESLHKWFSRKGAPGKVGGWVDCNTCRTVDGKKKCKPCGRKDGEKRKKYPSCRPTPAQCKTPGKGKKWGKTK